MRTLPLSRGGSVESLPARTQCLASSDSKRMSADLSELEPKMPFPSSGKTRQTRLNINKSDVEQELNDAIWHAPIISRFSVFCKTLAQDSRACRDGVKE